MNQAALKQYQAVGVQGGVTDASPHQLIGMLLTGALDRIASARGAATRGEVQRKGELLSRSIAIIDNLRASLDREKGGEIAANLGLADLAVGQLWKVQWSRDSTDAKASALDSTVLLRDAGQPQYIMRWWSNISTFCVP